MCGICGLILPASTSIDGRAALSAMARAMHHRGPDDEGLFLESAGRVGLGTRRLAIRDLSPAGHMPMGNDDGTVWISYNGEIYNTDEIRPALEALGYHFRSTSDTEVILRGYEAWGERVVERLRGMFAFAIYDGRAGNTPPHLFLARDRLGIKPLYYATNARGFYFASELNALLASRQIAREISPTGLVGYLLFGAVPNPLTIYREIHALPPGHTLTIPMDGENLRVPVPVQYWRLPMDTTQPTSEQDVVAEVRALLEEAVRIRLVSDVPLGAFLSGGLDSSIIVALMRQATNGTLRTCSITFQESAYSESVYARAVAEQVGAEHYERTITSDELLQATPAVFAAMDQPTVDAVNSYFVSETARQAGLTVALSGLGGDELFGGYPNTFKQVPLMTRAMRVAQQIPGGVPAARALIKVLPDAASWARFSDALTEPAANAPAYMARRGLFAPREVAALVGQDLWEEARTGLNWIEHVASRADSPRGDDFAWISRAELSTYTHHQLLRDTDVMSMAHSLEVRVPFLDHRLVEYILRLPASFKQNGGTPKPLLVKAAGDLLPASVRERRDKKGFSFPFAPWLRGAFGQSVNPTRDPLPLLQSEAVHQVWQEFQAGRMHWSRAWTLVALNEWHKQRPA